jgi:hypothetical protein
MIAVESFKAAMAEGAPVTLILVSLLGTFIYDEANH